VFLTAEPSLYLPKKILEAIQNTESKHTKRKANLKGKKKEYVLQPDVRRQLFNIFPFRKL